MNTQKPKLQKINLNGKEVEALNLTPQSDNGLAIVDFTVLRRLTDLLPKANLFDIKQAFIDKIREKTTLNEFVLLLEEEMAFHKTVNLITLVYNGEQDIEDENLTLSDCELE